jgi:hypothetical protein
VVLPRPEGGQVGVVGGSGVGDAALAARVQVAEVEGQALRLVGGERVVVPQLVVAGRLRGALEATPP